MYLRKLYLNNVAKYEQIIVWKQWNTIKISRKRKLSLVTNRNINQTIFTYQRKGWPLGGQLKKYTYSET